MQARGGNGGRVSRYGRVFFALVLLLVGCRVDDAAFYDRVYRCDASAPTNECGTTRSGAAMSCFPGSRFGSVDFCAESCGADASTATGSVCVPPGGVVGTCAPSAGRNQPGCASGLACFAADLSLDRGYCLPACGESDGCEPPVSACDSSAGPNACPLRADGSPQTCVVASQLGGQDFCAPSCDVAQGPADPADVCVEPGAELRTCEPRNALVDWRKGCPSGLSCFRTNLFADSGVCLWMHVCSVDTDCSDGMECGSSVIRTLDPSPAALALLSTDGLQCVTPRCAEGENPCGQTEGCLARAYSAPDVCVPNCQGPDLICPPNYSCALLAAGPGSPSLCVPGLPSVKCTSDEGCLIGQCLDTGANFNVCSIPCIRDDDCSVFDVGGDTFTCVSGGGTRHCVAPRAFDGASCDARLDDAETCPDGQHCHKYASGPDFRTTLGECRTPCDAEHPCPAFGGLPHVCLGADGGCFPGEVGLPCNGDSECIGLLRCVDPDTGQPSKDATTGICTVPCNADDPDCSGKTGSGNGFCADGFCRAPGATGAPCSRAKECTSGACDTDTGKCLNE